MPPDFAKGLATLNIMPHCVWTKNKNRSTSEKGRNGHGKTVSPFDGASRIRFKGSQAIADLRLPIANEFNSNRQSKIGNRQCPDSQPRP
jgi:hypothetical protein